MTYQKLIYHLGIFILLLSACSNQADREDKDTTTTDGSICHYADVYNPEHRADMDKGISRIMQGQSSNMPTTRDVYRQESCM